MATAHQEGDTRFRTIFDQVPVSIWEEDWADVIARIQGIRASSVVDFEGYFAENSELVLELLRSVRIVDPTIC